MTKTRRIFHHACWFALLGPHLGVPVTFAGELLTNHRTAENLLLQIVLYFPYFMAATWFLGGGSALLTGIAAACLPTQIYQHAWHRSLACGAMGSVIATLYGLIYSGSVDSVIFWMATGPGLLAGLIMGRFVPYLPGRGDKKYVRPALVKIPTGNAQPELKE